MFYSPESSFEIRTDLGREMVVKILEQNVERFRLMPPLFAGASFTGKISSSEFTIRERSLLYRFIPKFEGSIEDSADGTILKVDAVNGNAKFTVVFGWFASLVTLVGSLQPLLKHDYLGMVGCILGALLFGSMAGFFHWLYDRKLEEGRRKLNSLFSGAATG